MSTGFVKKDFFGGAMTGNIPVGYLDVRFVSFFLSFLSEYIALGISSLIEIGGFFHTSKLCPSEASFCGRESGPFFSFEKKAQN